MVLPFGEIKWIKSVQTYYRGDFQEKNKQNIGWEFTIWERS